MKATRIFLAVALTIAGCATVSKEDALKYGSFEVVHGNAAPKGVVLGAPHGTADTNTDMITKLVAQDLGYPAVIARGFTKKETGDHRINVNRPTEGAGLRPSEEIGSVRAEHVYAEYSRLEVEASGGEVKVLVEFHCTGDRLVGGVINVGTSGLSAEQATRVKQMYYRALDAVTIGTHVRRVDLAIEPIDRVPMGSGAAKARGTPRLARRAMEIEMPISMTTLAVGDGPYRKIYAGFLREAIPYLLAE
jgi:hypothetical protein